MSLLADSAERLFKPACPLQPGKERTDKTDCLEEWSYYEPGTSPSNGNVQDELDKAPGPESPLVIAEYHSNIILCCSVTVQGGMCQGCQREIHRETLGLHLGEGWGV